MNAFSAKALVAGLLLVVALPTMADDDDGWRHRKHHHHHRHHHDHYRGDDYRGPCRIEGWYDRYGDYRERRVCRERGGSRVMVPMMPMMPPAVHIQPPALILQPPGVYVR